uniref:Uncharacterized protein n=1 Tax=Anopheles maculatus TaxID=74869 RepID=A0A182T0N3_9DIPT
MFKVPDEHFQAIADIAAQPEAPKEPTDIVLAAFAYGQTLMEILSEYMQVTESQQISAVSTSTCDECSSVPLRSRTTKNHIPSITTATTAKETIESTVPTIGGGGGGGGVPPVPSSAATTSSTPATSTPQTAPQPIGLVSQDQSVNITEDEDGYCEIDEVRAAAVLLAENEKARKLTEASKLAAAAAATAVDTLDDGGGVGGDVGRAPKSPESHIEINENYDSTMSPSMTQKYSGPLGVELCGKNRLLHASTVAPTVPCHLIANYVTGLNAQISQLLHKINEKDIEREHLRRENQHLRELLNAMHQERVLESQHFALIELDQHWTHDPLIVYTIVLNLTCLFGILTVHQILKVGHQLIGLVHQHNRQHRDNGHECKKFHPSYLAPYVLQRWDGSSSVLELLQRCPE